MGPRAGGQTDRAKASLHMRAFTTAAVTVVLVVIWAITEYHNAGLADLQARIEPAESEGLAAIQGEESVVACIADPGISGWRQSCRRIP